MIVCRGKKGFLVAAVFAALVVTALPAEATSATWEEDQSLSDIAVARNDATRYGTTGGEILIFDRSRTVISRLPWPGAERLDVDDDRIVVSGSPDGVRTYLSVLTLDGGLLQRLLWSTYPEPGIADIALSEGKLVVASGGGIQVLDPATLVTTQALRPESDLRYFKLGSDGDRLLVASVNFSSPTHTRATYVDTEVSVYDHLQLTRTVTLVDPDPGFGFVTDVTAGAGDVFYTLDEIGFSATLSEYTADGVLAERSWTAPEGYPRMVDGGIDVDGCHGVVGTVVMFDVKVINSGFKHVPADRDPGCFVDSLDSRFLNSVAWLGREGVTQGCNPSLNDRFCPDRHVTRGEMAALLVRALNYTDDGGGNRFIDDDGSVFEGAIDRLAAAGVTEGCNPPTNTDFCPDDFVTRGQMAAFLVRAMHYTDDGGGNRFIDDDGSVFEDAINRLAAAGVTKGCDPPDNSRYCPSDFVTRGETAAFLKRALG